MEDQSLGSLALLSHCRINHPAGYMSYLISHGMPSGCRYSPNPVTIFSIVILFLLLGRFGRPSTPPLRRTLAREDYVHGRLASRVRLFCTIPRLGLPDACSFPPLYPMYCPGSVVS